MAKVVKTNSWGRNHNITTFAFVYHLRHSGDLAKVVGEGGKMAKVVGEGGKMAKVVKTI